MNPWTGRMERVTGTTYDGIDVFESQAALGFALACFTWQGAAFDVYFTIEFNRNAHGKRRPYYVVSLFGLRVTGGWLFTCHEPEPTT